MESVVLAHVELRKALIAESPVTSCCLSRSDHILCSVTWVTDERVAVQWLTREQNYLVVQTYELDGGSWKETQVGRSHTRLRFSPSNNYFCC